MFTVSFHFHIQGKLSKFSCAYSFNLTNLTCHKTERKVKHIKGKSSGEIEIQTSRFYLLPLFIIQNLQNPILLHLFLLYSVVFRSLYTLQVFFFRSSRLSDRHTIHMVHNGNNYGVSNSWENVSFLDFSLWILSTQLQQTVTRGVTVFSCLISFIQENPYCLGYKYV